jgi:hypothetical protein
MTEAWGVEPLVAGGKVVWAELRSSSEPAAEPNDEENGSVRRGGGGSSPIGPPVAGPGFCVASRHRAGGADGIAVARRAGVVGRTRARRRASGTSPAGLRRP